MSIRTKSRLTSLLLCMAVFLSLAGCAGEDSPVKADSETEQLSFTEKSFPLPEGMSWASAQCLLGDRVFTAGRGNEAPAAGIVELQSGNAHAIDLPDEIEHIYAVCADGDGAAMLCGDSPEAGGDGGQTADGPNTNGSLYILHYTPDGELAGRTELSEAYTDSFTLMAGLGGGYVLLSPETLVGIDADGNETGRISRGDGLPFTSMCLDGDELIVSRSELGRPKAEICALNTDSFKLKTLTKTEGMISGLGLWTDGRLLTSDRVGSGVKLLDTETGQAQELLFLFDVGLENRRVLSMEAWSGGLVFFHPGQERISLALPESGEDGPTELILATDTATSPLTLLVSRFNSENKDYRIKIKEYANQTGLSGKDRLATEMMAGNAPDIFAFHQTNFFPENSGYFEDLLPWLDGDSEYGRDTFVPGLLEALTEKRALYCVPYEFELYVYVSGPEAIGEKMSFSIDELAQLKQSLDPSQNLFDYFGGLNIQSMLYGLMLNSFIDYETKTCTFDSPEFVQMLEFIKDITPPYPPDENTPGIYDDNYLIRSYPLQNFSIVAGLKKNFGDTYNFVEITRGEDNSFCLDPIWSFYMSSQSEHKEIVWEFIRSTFREDSPRHELGSYLPAAQAAFQAQVDASLAGELYDYAGNKIELVQSDVDKLLELLGKTRYTVDGNDPVIGIIHEETGAYFAGDKTAREVAEIIQSRASIYVAEQR